MTPTKHCPFNFLDQLGGDFAHYPKVLADVNAEPAERGLESWESLNVEVPIAVAHSTTFPRLDFVVLIFILYNSGITSIFQNDT
ncbi:MAG: hypothetical protein OXI05_08300 [Bacteroidota bacterium]|nr:hypothetical protein [Bacteroidota bacterium]MXW31897.1 hypothetical protein [Rhodothermaceae bacterium]MDE2645823.1 hypothetical protein [Bacteroidota bacterium]MXZ17321.1 hypothetical protein [Rhodothermaceae bacterium]MYC03434.1 hypothetical protein [Rhodothermaceae bacterium]